MFSKLKSIKCVRGKGENDWMNVEWDGQFIGKMKMSCGNRESYKIIKFQMVYCLD